MNKILELTPEIAIPLGFAAGGLIAGWIFEKILLSRLAKLAQKTKWKGDDLIVESLKGTLIFLFFIGGLYGAVLNIPALPESISIIMKRILLILAILLGTTVITKISVKLVDLYSQNLRGAKHASSIFTNITRLIVIALGLLVILQTLGISITPIITALGVGGLAVALALQDTLANFFAGIHIIASKQLKPADYVELSTGEKGYVEDISWRNTTIRALANNMIIVPNSKLASAIIINYYKPSPEMAVLVPVGVSYDSDLKKVERVTIEVGKETLREVAGGVPDFEPFIRYNEFSDSSVNFNIILRCKEFVDQYLIKHEFIKRLHERYKKENINIPFPIRTVYMHRERG